MIKTLENYSKWTKIGLAVAFLLGIIIRAIQYISEPSMWKDELFSVVNIESMSFWELMTEQPEYNQVAPVGFYIIQKFFYTLIGSTEMAFRLYPFIASILSLWLFYLIARKFLDGIKLVLAVFFMATVLGPFWQSFNAKPYTGDIMFLMFYVWIGLTILERQLSNKETWVYAIIGFIGASASFPASIFVFVLLGGFLLKNKKEFLNSYAPIIVLWILGALWNIGYAKFIISPEVADAMAEHHAKRFPPSGLIDYLLFFPKQLTLSLVDFLMVIKTSNPIFMIRNVIIFLLSAITLYPIIKHKRLDLFILIIPFFMMLGLVAFYVLPMGGRTAYYGLWIFLLLPFIGLAFLQKELKWIKPWLTNIVAILIVLPSILIVGLGMTGLPIAAEPIKKVLNFYNENKKPGDVLYVQGSGDLYMEYYGPKIGVDDYVLGEYSYTISADDYANDLKQLKGNKRVWFFFTGFRPEMNPELSVDDIKTILSEEAELLEEHPFKSAGYPNFINLYDFSSE